MSRPASSIRKLLVPREHGSWGLWTTPLVSAAIVALIRRPAGVHDASPSITALVLFALMSASAFMVYQPLEELLGLSLFKLRTPEEKRAALLWIACFGLIASALFIIIFMMGRERLIWLAALAAACFGARAAFGMRRRFRVLKELIGALALASTAPGAYYCVWAVVDRASVGLWLASWLFAVAQIEYVQFRIHSGIKPAAGSQRPASSPSRGFFQVLAFHLLLPVAAAAAWLLNYAPPLLALAFLPALFRTVVWKLSPPRKLNVRRLGVTELILGIAFGLLLATAYAIG